LTAGVPEGESPDCIEETESAEEAKPAEEAEATEETEPAEETKSVQEAEATEKTEPAVETKATQEAKPARPVVSRTGRHRRLPSFLRRVDLFLSGL
jgi:hypothetical protein